jgi:eukaryotic-like serine/threonine-protein kinase
MALAAGTRLGPYEIHSLIGAGGMGEVYKSRDTQLQRDVALKILPFELALDPERLARFDREAHALAALNHPNIAQVYGLAHHGDVRAIVMELVEGPTLAERIARGPVPVDEALPVAIQFADALEYAHERGIVHRDLKPANIKLTPDGAVKILDFGLAKVLAGDRSGQAADLLANSPTITSPPMSRVGVILGTAAYMSPEQARGTTVDKRADIWAFGVVLFEMLTGKPCFAGETVTDVLAAVVKAEPDWALLPAATPARLRELLQRCLAKDRRQRLHDIGDARIDLERMATAEKTASEPAGSAPAGPRRARRAALIAITAIVIVALGFAGGRFLSSPNGGAWAGERLEGPELALGPRISPAGDTLAFQQMVGGTTQVAVMKPETGYSQVLTRKSDAGWVNQVSWASDGNRIYFDRCAATPLGIYSTPPVPGDERLELPDAFAPEALPGGGLLVVKVNASRRFQVYRFADGNLRPLPVDLGPSSKMLDVTDSTRLRASRDGKEAFVVGYLSAAPAGKPHLFAIELASGNVRQITTGLTDDGAIKALAPGLEAGTILIAEQSGDLHRVLALPTNGSAPPRTLLTTTSPIWFLDTGHDGVIYADQLAISRGFWRFGRQGGHAEKIGAFWTQPSGYMEFALLPDDRIAYLSVRGERSRLMIAEAGKDPFPLLNAMENVAPPLAAVGQDEVGFLDAAASNTIVLATAGNGQVRERIPFNKGRVSFLTSSPDGQTLYAAADGAIWAIPRRGDPRRVCDGDEAAAEPDGRSLIVKRLDSAGISLQRVPLDGAPVTTIRLTGPFHLGYFALRSEAIDREGRMLVPLFPPNSWYQVPGVVDLTTGNTMRIPVDYSGDYAFLAWTADRHIVAAASEHRFSLWRFRRER